MPAAPGETVIWSAADSSHEVCEDLVMPLPTDSPFPAVSVDVAEARALDLDGDGDLDIAAAFNGIRAAFTSPSGGVVIGSGDAARAG